MLEVTNLACMRGDHTLFTGLQFRLSRGELLHVQGENGSGKTTLLRALCGLVQPVDGAVSLEGVPISELAEEYHANLAYLGHANAIKDELSALENLVIGGRLMGCDIDEAAAIAILRKLGLKGRENFPSRMLSQGQRRRVALARLLVNRAPLWILDEPLVALDVGAVAMMQDEISQHLHRQGMVIYTTHQSLQVPGVIPKSVMLS